MNNHLNPRPNDCSKKSIVERRTEDISVNQLPSCGSSIIFWQDKQKAYSFTQRWFNDIQQNETKSRSKLMIWSPVSSMLSSMSSSAMLYFAMSRLRVRMMIIVMMPERKKTTTTELTMENQWIWVSCTCKYTSTSVQKLWHADKYTCANMSKWKRTQRH